MRSLLLLPIVAVLVAVVGLSGCMTGQLIVTSSPEGADVLKINENGTVKQIGKTPLTIDMVQVASSTDSHVQLTVSLDKFKNESVLIPRGMFEATHNLKFHLISLDEVNSQNGCPKIPKDGYSKLARGVAETLELIAKKELSSAITQLQLLSSQFPFVSVLFDLKGNIFFLQRNFKDALKSYEQSLELWPHNPQTVKMVKRIQEMSGSDSRMGG